MRGVRAFTLYIRLLILLLLGFHSPFGKAAELVMEALNFHRCEHWFFEGAGWPPEGYQRFCSSCPDLEDYWVTLYAESRIDKRLGVCNYKRNKKGDHFDLYRCEESPGFPMSSATYRRISHGDKLPTYECVHGCTENTAIRVYELGWESDEPNYEYEEDIKQFYSKCKLPTP